MHLQRDSERDSIPKVGSPSPLRMLREPGCLASLRWSVPAPSPPHAWFPFLREFGCFGNVSQAAPASSAPVSAVPASDLHGPSHDSNLTVSAPVPGFCGGGWDDQGKQQRNPRVGLPAPLCAGRSWPGTVRLSVLLTLRAPSPCFFGPWDIGVSGRVGCDVGCL